MNQCRLTAIDFTEFCCYTCIACHMQTFQQFWNIFGNQMLTTKSTFIVFCFIIGAGFIAFITLEKKKRNENTFNYCRYHLMAFN